MIPNALLRPRCPCGALCELDGKGINYRPTCWTCRKRAPGQLTLDLLTTADAEYDFKAWLTSQPLPDWGQLMTELGRRNGGGVGLAGYCHHCDQWMKMGPDACLGVIPGVSHACCGHGDIEAAYVVLGGSPLIDCDLASLPADEYVTLRGADAATFFGLIQEARDG